MFFSRFVRTLLPIIVLLAIPGCKRTKSPAASQPDPVTRQARQIWRDQAQNDLRIWESETRAHEYAGTLDRLMDSVRLRKPEDRWAALRGFRVGELLVPRSRDKKKDAAWDIESHAFSESRTSWSGADWLNWLNGLEEKGYVLDYFSTRLAEFLPPSPGNSLDRALVEIAVHARQLGQGQAGDETHYHSLKGKVRVTWERPMVETKTGPISRVLVEDLVHSVSTREPAFQLVRRYAVEPNNKRPFRVTPLIVTDLDRNGHPDIVLAGVNQLLRNQGGLQFKAEAFMPHVKNTLPVAAIAELTGDGYEDYVAFDADGHAMLFAGNGVGTFASESTRPWDWKADYPSSLAIADIDKDGDLDIWLSQMRPTYYRGVLPNPFYDANDGFPSALFRNDGTGTFTEVAKESGLDYRHLRRTRSSAFVDWDRDGDSDLVVVSDYAGIEAYLNDGKGQFKQVRRKTFGQWHLLGQCLALGDFDRDQRVDFFAGGRWSRAVHRMDAMNLERSDFPDFRSLATQIASGNQLYRSSREYDSGLFVEARDGKVIRDDRALQRTGWTKSATAADFDNDGDDDLYLTNGHLTGASVEEFDSQFWRHDVFLTEGIRPEVLQRYIQTPAYSPRLAALRKSEISWHGYETNHLLVNGGLGFVDAGFAHRVALPQDSPGAVAVDLDDDGLQDLVTITQRTFPLNERLAVEQSVIVFRNQQTTQGHWIGFDLHPNVSGYVRTGATVQLRGAFGTRIARVTTGEQGSLQGAARLHFGLGDVSEIDHAIVTWGSGQVHILASPAVDRYHRITPLLDFTPVPEPPEPEPEEIETAETTGE